MSRDNENEESKLGYLLSAVREHAGPDGISALMRELGGVILSVPANPHSDHPLTRVFGLAVARNICRELTILGRGSRLVGLGRVAVPQGRFSRSAALRAEIKRLAEASELSPQEIALRLRCHERTVWRVLALLRHRRSPQLACSSAQWPGVKEVVGSVKP